MWRVGRGQGSELSRKGKGTLLDVRYTTHVCIIQDVNCLMANRPMHGTNQGILIFKKFSFNDMQEEWNLLLLFAIFTLQYKLNKWLNKEH